MWKVTLTACFLSTALSVARGSVPFFAPTLAAAPVVPVPAPLLPVAAPPVVPVPPPVVPIPPRFFRVIPASVPPHAHSVNFVTRFFPPVSPFLLPPYAVPPHPAAPLLPPPAFYHFRR